MTPDLDVACQLSVLVPDPRSPRLPESLDALAASGYRRVVLPPFDADAVDVPHLRALLADRGLVPIAMAIQLPEADVAAEDPGAQAAGAALLRQSLALAVALGADQLNGVPYGLFGPPRGTTGSAAFARSAAAVGRIADEAHERGVAMVFEVLNRYETSAINTARRAMDYAEAGGSAHLGIHLDTFHMAIEESDIAEAVRLALPRLRYLELGQSGRGALSHGAIDIPGIVRDALDAGYRGRWGVEAFSRSVLAPEGADGLSIWRDVYDDGVELARDAMRVIGAGWATSTVGRRASRLSRIGST